MTQAKVGDTVRVHYKGTLEDGTQFDSSENRSPLEFTIGAGKVIRGVEETVVGMAPGETKTEKINSDRAYGPHREDMVFEMNRVNVPDEIEPKVGQWLQMQSPDGNGTPVCITQVSDDSITLDANHPLAGKDLTFDIELVEIC